MPHGRVRDVGAEGDVQVVEVEAVLCQEADADVADVVARPKVQVPQGPDSRDRLEAGVSDADAEAQVHLLQLRETGGDVPQRLIRQLLTVLQTEVLQGSVAVDQD